MRPSRRAASAAPTQVEAAPTAPHTAPIATPAIVVILRSPSRSSLGTSISASVR